MEVCSALDHKNNMEFITALKEIQLLHTVTSFFYLLLSPVIRYVELDQTDSFVGSIITNTYIFFSKIILV